MGGDGGGADKSTDTSSDFGMSDFGGFDTSFDTGISFDPGPTPSDVLGGPSKAEPSDQPRGLGSVAVGGVGMADTSAPMLGDSIGIGGAIDRLGAIDPASGLRASSDIQDLERARRFAGEMSFPELARANVQFARQEMASLPPLVKAALLLSPAKPDRLIAGSAIAAALFGQPFLVTPEQNLELQEAMLSDPQRQESDTQQIASAGIQQIQEQPRQIETMFAPEPDFGPGLTGGSLIPTLQIGGRSLADIIGGQDGQRFT